MKKRILVILPDGVSLRNYVYTRFLEIAVAEELELIFWNNTPLDLAALEYQEIKFPNVQLHWQTDALKNAIIHTELNSYKAATGNPIFDQYKFAWNTIGIKNKLKTALAKRYIRKAPTQEYIVRLREKLKRQERSTAYYVVCKRQIQEINPDIIFCASQRPIAAVAPMLAAKDLGIPTVCSIFSWDNLPKATLVVEADHYLVWSEHMKKELQTYYPFINNSKTHVVGTPQFENHYDKTYLLTLESFYNNHSLDHTKEYICFSGDDVTTSPFDPQYLADVAEAVGNYNLLQETQLGIIFRRCPVDFSDRYDWVLQKYKDAIVPIAPLWESVGAQWDKKIPTKADLELQANIAHHTKMVVNVGSSMVFDYAAHNTPCAYLNYNPEGSDTAIKDIHTIYKFVHFQSMPSKEAVIWIYNKVDILKQLETIVRKQNHQLDETQNWFQKIVKHPVEESSLRTVDTLKKIE